MKKKLLAAVLTMAMTAGICTGCGTKDTGGEVIAGENQRLAYAVVTAIEGNDMTYMEVDESQLNLNNEASTESAGSGQQRPQMSGERPEMSSEMSSMPEMNMEDFTPPDGEMPDMNGEMPDMENFTPPDMNGTTAEAQIPVGVPVYTTADTKTTFSRIQSGDIVKILFETDADGNEVILEIWMIQ